MTVYVDEKGMAFDDEGNSWFVGTKYQGGYTGNEAKFLVSLRDTTKYQLTNKEVDSFVSRGIQVALALIYKGDTKGLRFVTDIIQRRIQYQTPLSEKQMLYFLSLEDRSKAFVTKIPKDLVLTFHLGKLVVRNTQGSGGVEWFKEHFTFTEEARGLVPTGKAAPQAKPKPAPAAPPSTSGGGKVQVLEELVSADPSNSFLSSILSQVRAGRVLSEKQLAAVRRILYQRGKRDKADLFRMASGSTDIFVLVTGTGKVQGASADAKARHPDYYQWRRFTAEGKEKFWAIYRLTSVPPPIVSDLMDDEFNGTWAKLKAYVADASAYSQALTDSGNLGKQGLAQILTYTGGGRVAQSLPERQNMTKTLDQSKARLAALANTKQASTPVKVESKFQASADRLQALLPVEGKTASDIIKAIKPGDRVTIRTPQGQEMTGRAVMKGPHGWVLNMGGKHGTPGIATEENIVHVKPGRRASDEVEKEAVDKEAEATIGKGRYKYLGMYRGKKVVVWADTQLEAQELAAAHLKARKSYEVSIGLLEKDGKPVVHLPLMASTDHAARFEEGKSVDVPEYLRNSGNPEAAEKWEEMNEKHRDNFKSADDHDEMMARFEEGESADPTENMSPEDAKKWREEHEKNKDNFKAAAERQQMALPNGWVLKWNPAQPDRVSVDDEGEGSWSDEALLGRGGKITYDFPERVPGVVQDAVKKFFRKVRRAPTASFDAAKYAGLNGYVAIYKGKRIEVHAETSFKAQQIAAEKFKARRPSDVTVMLAEKDNKQVTHAPLFASDYSLTPLQTQIVSRVQEAVRSGGGISLSSLTRYPEFRTKHFKDIQNAAVSLDKKGIITLAQDPDDGFVLRLASSDDVLAEGCPDNLDESECAEWEANTDKYEDVVKDQHKTAGMSVLEYIIDQSGFADLGDIVDEQTYDLAYEVYSDIQRDLTLGGNKQEALRRLKASVDAGRKWDEAMHRNNIFKAANSMGMRLPSAFFASVSKDAGCEKLPEALRENCEKKQEGGSDKAASSPSGLYGFTRKVQADCETSIRKLQKRASQIAKQAYKKDERVAEFLSAHAKKGESVSAKLLCAALKELGPKVASEDKTAGGAGSTIRFKHQYLDMFFREKNLPYKSWSLTDETGMTHDISNEVVLEHIAITSRSEKEAIADTIRKIDFKNGDVNHYLKHLAGALINQPDLPRFANTKEAASSATGHSLYGYPTKTVRLGLQCCASLREEAGRIASDLHTRRAEMYEHITGFLKEHSRTARCTYSKILHASYPDGTTKLASSKSASDWIAWEDEPGVSKVAEEYDFYKDSLRSDIGDSPKAGDALVELSKQVNGTLVRASILYMAGMALDNEKMVTIAQRLTGLALKYQPEASEMEYLKFGMVPPSYGKFLGATADLANKMLRSIDPLYDWITRKSGFNPLQPVPFLEHRKSRWVAVPQRELVLTSDGKRLVEQFRSDVRDMPYLQKGI